MDVTDICDRKELHLQPGLSGKTGKPNVKFVLAMDKRREWCELVKGLNMPDGYCSDLRNIMDPNEAKFNNIKSHDCHMFMETMLPIAFVALSDDVLKPPIEVGFLRIYALQHCERM